MKITALLVFVCLAVASASNIRGQDPELRDEVNAARAAETGAAASAASSTHDDATGSAETPMIKRHVKVPKKTQLQQTRVKPTKQQKK